MGDTIVDWFTTGVNTVMQSGVLYGAIGMLSVATMFGWRISEEQAVRAEIQAFNEYNEYDFTHVYATDVISTIVRYRGELKVVVNSDKGTCTWDVDTPLDQFSIADIESKIQSDVVYDSDLMKNPNGAILGISFRKHADGCGR